MPDAQIFYYALGNIDILLHTIRHKNAEYSVLSKCFHTEGCNSCRVLSAGDADHRRGCRAVFLKPLPNPHYAVLCNFCIISLCQIVTQVLVHFFLRSFNQYSYMEKSISLISIFVYKLCKISAIFAGIFRKIGT